LEVKTKTVMKRISMVVLCGFFLSPSLLAQKFQPGYIITKQFDTVYGLLANRNYLENGSSCKFKRNENSEVLSYKPFEISSYRFTNGKYYISKEITIDSIDQKVFLEYLIKGKANIYFIRKLNGDYYFIQKENGPMVILKSDEVNPTYEHVTMNGNSSGNGAEHNLVLTKKYTGTIKYILRDEPQLYDEIDKSDLDHKSLIKIARDYHDLICKDQDCIIYEKKTKRKIGIEITGFFGTMKYSSADLGKTEYSAFKPQLYGVSMLAQLLLLNEQMAFKPSLLLGTASIESTEAKSVDKELITKFSATNFDIPLMLQVNLLAQKNFNVYFDLGPYLEYTNTKVKQAYYLSGIGIEPVDYSSGNGFYSKNFKGLYIGGGISLGMNFKLTKQVYLGTGANYNLTVKSGATQRHSMNAFISAGYLLK
jgi:hypothetical protein